MAAQMEDAGNREDMGFIDANTVALLEEYAGFKEKLERIRDEDDGTEKEMIPDEMLNDAYSALSDVVPQMDYDSVEMILESLNEYALPKEDDKIIKELQRMLKSFDWEGMEGLIKGGNNINAKE